MIAVANRPLLIDLTAHETPLLKPFQPLFMWALRWLPPTTTVLYLTLNPMTAMVLGVVLLGEKLTFALIAGMALVLLGIMIGSGFYAQIKLLPGERR